MTQLFFDVSSLARWTGPPVGIARTEHALVRAARQRPDTIFCVWERRRETFRVLRPEWAELVLGWRGAIDVRAPHFSPLSRHPSFRALERVRLTSRLSHVGRVAEAAQDLLLSGRRHGHRLRDGSGQRIAHVPDTMALGDEARPEPGDVVFSAGAGWAHGDAAPQTALKRRIGFRAACLCYDLIPITHPQFYSPEDQATFARHWRRALPGMDLVIANARCIAADLRRFCVDEGLPPPPIAVLPLGYDPPAVAPGKLPPPLEPGRYALFVSTIEPRKGHAMLLRVWRRLLAAGVPQRRRFRLVLVGRPGWMVDAVLRTLAEGDGLQGTVHHFQDLGDDAVQSLYANASFTLYPSDYEGFGLPVLESFAHGRPVLASSGGALPETVAGLCPCLPPGDEAAWEAAIALWIEGPPPPIAAPPHPGWAAAAAAILDRVVAA